MFKFFPHTQTDINVMLAKIGVKEIDDLFSEVDPSLFTKEFNIPESKSEYELKQLVSQLAKKNRELISFMGAGSYDVFTPSVCSAIISRQERSEEHTSELQSRPHLVCRLLLEKKKKVKEVL